MNKAFYELYKGTREMVEAYEKDSSFDDSDPIDEFIREIKIGIERQDKADEKYLKQYLKEKGHNIE